MGEQQGTGWKPEPLSQEEREYGIKHGGSSPSQAPLPEPVWPSVRPVVLGDRCDRAFLDWKSLGRLEESLAR